MPIHRLIGDPVEDVQDVCVYTREEPCPDYLADSTSSLPSLISKDWAQLCPHRRGWRGRMEGSCELHSHDSPLAGLTLGTGLLC